MIRLVTLCLDQAVASDHESVMFIDMESALKRFSQERIEELASELKHRFSGLDALVHRLKGYPKEFDLDKVSELAIQLALDVEEQNRQGKQYSWAGGYEPDHRGLAKVLIECGILRHKPSRSCAPEEYNPDSDVEITSRSWFAISPVFLPALGHPIS